MKTASGDLIPASFVLPLIVCVTLAAVALTLYCLSHGISTVFMHLYYLPIILIAYFYRRRGVPALIGLSLLYLALAMYFLYPSAIENEAAGLRTGMFILIGVVVAELSERLEKKKEEHRIAEEDLKGIIDNANVWLTILDTKGKIIVWNRAAETISGYRAEEVVGQYKIWKALYPDREYRKKITGIITRIITDKNYLENFETSILAKDGSTRTISWNTRGLTGPGGTVDRYVAIGLDVTERKQAEEALHLTNAMLTSQMEATIDGILAVDADGKILSYNNRFVEIWGIPPGMIALRDDAPVLKTVLGQLANPEEFLARVQYLYAHREEKSQEEIRLKDSRTIDRYSAPLFGNDRRYYGRVWYFRDITERKKAEQEIERIANEWEVTFNATSDGICLIDADQNILRCCGADVPSTTRFCVNCGAKMGAQRTCPQCRTPIIGDPEFCRSCGKSLRPKRKCPKCNATISGSPEFCRSCGTALPETRPCPTCGAIVNKTAKFCNGCGRVLEPAPAPKVAATATVDSTAIPDLFVMLDQISLAAATWHKMPIQITNTGKAHAFFVTLSFSSDFETRRIKPTTVESGETKVVEIGIMPKTKGNIPLEITMNYKDSNNREYTKTNDFWIDVRQSVPHIFDPETDMLPEKTVPPTPRSTQPAARGGGVTMRSLPPEMTEKYIESEFIGKGGFARVFKAKRKDGVYVAVKVPIDLDESTGKSFISEMQNWTKFSHPNIVKIYDYNIMPIPYFEEELCDSALDKMKKPLDCAKAAWIIFNICEGLKYAHARQVIHRDLKPQNILLKSGIPKISDWGLSKVVTDATSSTTASFTPFYAAPEQVSNKTKDQRTDIWQVGVILYELVTGTLPFTGENMLEIVSNISTANPVPPGDVNPEAKKIEPVILRCLEREPAKRYQSVADLQKDLAGFLKIDYTESLRMSVGSKNFRQSAEYCSKLLLANLKSGDLLEAYKYGTDLANYTEGEVRELVKQLSDQIRLRIDNDLNEVPDEIIEAADLIAHKIGVGLTTV